MTELAFSTIPELGALLRSRAVSAVELAGAALDRLETLGPRYGAVTAVLRERALREARVRDRELAAGRIRGPLHGIPYGVKALLAVAGDDAAADATAVTRLGDAGAVLCARLAMVEAGGAMGCAVPSAPTALTPWGEDRWAGGSSSGSAAAVAAGLLPFTLGSETWGSIQVPAACCGVTGLRPTYGRVSRSGATALSWTMDKIGPFARTAEDCGLVLGALAGPDPRDPTALAHYFTAPARTGARRRYRLGVLRGSRERLQHEVLANFEAALAVLRGFAEVVEDVTLPDYPWEALASTIVDAEAASVLEELGERPGGGAGLPEDGVGGRPGRRAVLATEYIRALRLRQPSALALDTVLRQFDGIVGPSLPTVAWPAGSTPEDAYPAYAGGTCIGGAANLAGVPGLFLMSGTGEAGLPTGIQLTGRALGEAALVTVAMRYQERTDHHRRRPPGL